MANIEQAAERPLQLQQMLSWPDSEAVFRMYRAIHHGCHSTEEEDAERANQCRRLLPSPSSWSSSFPPPACATSVSAVGRAGEGQEEGGDDCDCSERPPLGFLPSSLACGGERVDVAQSSEASVGSASSACIDRSRDQGWGGSLYADGSGSRMQTGRVFHGGPQAADGGYSAAPVPALSPFAVQCQAQAQARATGPLPRVHDGPSEGSGAWIAPDEKKWAGESVQRYSGDAQFEDDEDRQRHSRSYGGLQYGHLMRGRTRKLMESKGERKDGSPSTSRS